MAGKAPSVSNNHEIMEGVKLVGYFKFMHKNNRALTHKCLRIQVVRYARYAQSTPSNAAYQDNP